MSETQIGKLRTIGTSVSQLSLTKDSIVTDHDFITWTVLVTPDLAALWLEYRMPNRRLIESVVDKYANDMLSGSWHENHFQGIAFTREGKLLDGQHRLAAIVKSGCSILMKVTINIPDSYQATCDQGKPRGQEAGLLIMSKGVYDRKCVAIANFVFSCNSSHRRGSSIQEIFEFCEKHKENILFATSLFSVARKYISISPTMTACMKAAYYENHTRIAEFAKVLYSGVPETMPDDVSCLNFRRFCMDPFEVKNHAMMQMKRIHGFAEYAIKAFCDRRDLKKLRDPKKELFPLN